MLEAGMEGMREGGKRERKVGGKTGVNPILLRERTHEGGRKAGKE